MFNKRDTVSECVWVSITKIPVLWLVWRTCIQVLTACFPEIFTDLQANAQQHQVRLCNFASKINPDWPVNLLTPVRGRREVCRAKVRGLSQVTERSW